MDITSADYIKFKEEIRSQDLLDGALSLRLFFHNHTLDDLKSFYPTKTNNELMEAQTLAIKLLRDGCRNLDKFNRTRSASSAKYAEEAQVQFPEFSVLVIDRHREAADSLLAFSMSYDRDLTDLKLTEMGIYNAAALIDNRAQFKRYKYSISNFKEIVELPMLTDLFPWEPLSVIKVVNEKVNELAKYCAETAPDRRSKINDLYEQAKQLTKDENPGYSEKSYSVAFNHAHKALR